jgi:hypothetical protein
MTLAKKEEEKGKRKRSRQMATTIRQHERKEKTREGGTNRIRVGSDGETVGPSCLIRRTLERGTRGNQHRT